jgi:hypothetical protein
MTIGDRRSMKQARPALLAAVVALLLGVGAVSVTAARSTAAPPAVVVTACQNALSTAKAYGPITSVSGAFAATAGQVAAWQETRDGPNGPSLTSAFRRLPSGEPLFVCYYDGTFSSFPGPPLPNGQERQYGRIALIVDHGGKATFDRVGPTNVFAIVNPATR